MNTKGGGGPSVELNSRFVVGVVPLVDVVTLLATEELVVDLEVDPSGGVGGALSLGSSSPCVSKNPK